MDIIWTEKHNRFCIEHDLSKSAVALWQWLMRRERPDEISGRLPTDLREFNEWVAKLRGKPYSKTTVKRAVAVLENAGAIKVKHLKPWMAKHIVLREVL